MIYSYATDLFREKFNKEDHIPLFRDLQSREINPEIWDRQVKFWSTLILKWCDQFNIVDFSVNQLTQAFEFRGVIPHIQPSIDSLSKTHTLVSRDSFLKKNSFISSITSKLFGFINISNQQQCDEYIYVNNLKRLAKKIISDVRIKDSFVSDTVLTNEEIASKYCQDIDFEYLKFTLQKTDGVRVYNNGFYFKTDNYSDLSNDTINAVLQLKLMLNFIDKRLQDTEKDLKNQLSKAIQYKKQNMKAKALNCLRHKKKLESKEEQLLKMQEFFSSVLLKLDEKQLNKTIVNTINQVHINSKDSSSVQEIDNMMDELKDSISQLEEISDAIGSVSLTDNQIDDSEIENEFQELMGNEIGQQEQFESAGGFQFKQIREPVPAK